MKAFIRLSVVVFICFGLYTGVRAQDVPTKEAGTYRNGNDIWKVLVIPPGVSAERLARLAQTLHTADPATRFHLFDDDRQVQQLIQNKLHYPDSRNYPFPEKWYSRHYVGSVQTMTYDASGPQWVLVDRYQTKLASLEPEPITPREIRPTAASRRQALPGQVIIEYDSARNLTSVSLKVMKLASTGRGELHFSAMFAYEGRTPPRQDPFTLQILSIADEWTFANGADLTLSVDGVMMPLGVLKREFAEVSNGQALESVSRGLPYRMFMKIAGAKRVQGKIGAREFELTPEQLTSLVDLASRMQP
jgi:hypothetical protein